MLIGFSGHGSPQSWSRFYDDWFETHGWRTPTGWQNTGNAWTVQFESEMNATTGRVDIQFGEDSHGGLTGLINVTSP
jgi:hypothetical protein